MKYLSVCSGIEAATVAWKPLGWDAAAYAEIEAFPSAVLHHHYPETPNYGDLTRFKEWPDAAFDVLVGGTPCQSFSVAGLRTGLDDPRGSLMLTYLALAARTRPRWLVWENVPGVLSADDGRAFGSLLGGLAILGYGFAYRVLDAQYFGLAQRRARVFVVGCLGDWRRAAAVLFERESLSGHPAPRREAGEGVTAGTLRSTDGGLDIDHAAAGHILNERTNERTSIPHRALCLNAGGMGRIDAESETLIPIGGSFDVAHSLRADGFDASEDGTGRGIPLIALPLGTRVDRGGSHREAEGNNLVVSDSLRSHPRPGSNTLGAIAFRVNDHGADASENISPTIRRQGVQGVQGVRRLTPRECERLQGFPDDYTAIPYRGKLAADGPRYKALGNSMAVPVMSWIGRRIQMVELLDAR